MGALAFGPFRLSPTQRLLTENGKEVRLGGRAFDILLTLIERRGQLVSHEELRSRVWGTTKVDEGSLRVQMSALRKVLGETRSGDRYIRNEPGRGYCFVATVAIEREEPETSSERGKGRAWTPAPPPRSARTIGRDAFVENIAAQLPAQRFVTVIGAGGVGKTTVAVEVAERLLDSYRDGACFADLASLRSPTLLPSAIASYLGLGIYSEDPMPGVKAFLRQRHMLLLLDNCEHVIDAAAVFAEEVLTAARDVHILATSREPLRAAGEWVRRLPPLEQPPAMAGMTTEAALAFAAVQLFVERASANGQDFELTQQNVDLVVELCRRLEGIPLALELAAARVDELGLRGLAGRLSERFSLLMKGRRTALPRQKTLQGTLDWSYELLTDEEQALLRRLSVFSGAFRIDSAVAVGGWGAAAPIPAPENLANLVSKSLVSIDLSGDVERYRLFEMTRHYAREKLAATDEYDEVRRRHAEHLCAVFERAEADFAQMAPAEWKRFYSPHLDDIRAAIEWAYSPRGDARLGIALTAYTGILWTQLALMVEHRALVERALETNSKSSAPTPMLELRLTLALGSLKFHTEGPLVDAEAHGAFERALDFAAHLGDEPFRLRALTGCCAIRIMRGNYVDALTFAERFNQSANGADSPAANRTLAHNLHYLGDFVRLRRHLEAALAVADDVRRLRNTSGVEYDHRVTVNTILARTLWVTGRPREAMATARACVEDALAIDHAISLCLTLATCTCPLAFVCGGRAAAKPYLDLLRETAVKNSMIRWQYWADAYDVAMIRRDERLGSPLEAKMRRLAESPIDGPQLENLAILGDDYTDERLVARAAAGYGGWCGAEMVRARGEIALRVEGNRVHAESLFHDALALARATGMRAWELRAVTSLARLLRETNRRDEARRLLAPIVDAFADEGESVDVQTALDVLQTV